MSEEKATLEIPVTAQALAEARAKNPKLEHQIANFINCIAETGSGAMGYSDGSSGTSIAFGSSSAETRVAGNTQTKGLQISKADGWSETKTQGTSYSRSSSIGSDD